MKRILTSNSATIDLDIASSIVMVSFKGKVQFDQYKDALMRTVELVTEHTIENIMMNRLEIGELDPECRIWVKNEYLKVHIKPCIPNIKKVAVVEAKSIIGAFYGKALYSALSMIYPNLTFRYCDSISQAMGWFNEDKLAPNQLREYEYYVLGNDNVKENSTPTKIASTNKLTSNRAPKHHPDGSNVIEENVKKISSNQKEKILDKFLNFFYRTK
jgi:hypothetical protein